jgi:outer membrane lipoprotein-sorting protein
MNPNKTHSKLCTIIILLFAFTFPFALNALTVDEVLDQLDACSRVSDTLSQNVTMRMTIPGAEKMQRMKIYKKGGDKVRIENLDRAGDVTIINGDNMLMKVDGKEVIKQVGEKDKESLFSPAAFSFNSATLKKEYNISIKEDRSDIVILKLSPKESNVLYNMIEMAIDKDKWRVKGQKMYSNAGITKMNIEYDNNGNVSLIKMDSPLPHGSERGYMIMEYSNTNRGNISDDLFKIE